MRAGIGGVGHIPGLPYLKNAAEIFGGAPMHIP
jgi:hypothetical protein